MYPNIIFLVASITAVANQYLAKGESGPSDSRTECLAWIILMLVAKLSCRKCQDESDPPKAVNAASTSIIGFDYEWITAFSIALVRVLPVYYDVAPTMVRAFA